MSVSCKIFVLLLFINNKLRLIGTLFYLAIKKALNDGISKAAICRTFGVKRSTLIDSLNRENV